MFCANCGAKLLDGDKFCAECGTAVSGAVGNNTPPQMQYQQPSTNLEQDEPETILLKAMVTGENYPYGFGQNDGTLIITNKRVIYTSSRLLNVDLFGDFDSALTFYYDEIAEIKSTKYNLVFPAIEIITKNGYQIKFSGFGKIKTAYEIICEKIKMYTQLPSGNN